MLLELGDIFYIFYCNCVMSFFDFSYYALNLVICCESEEIIRYFYCIKVIICVDEILDND